MINMWIRTRIKSEKPNTPYRVYINDELITERFYACPKNWSANDRIQKTWNTLGLEIVDADDYKVRIENVPGYPKAKVWIDKVEWQEQPYED